MKRLLILILLLVLAGCGTEYYGKRTDVQVPVDISNNTGIVRIYFDGQSVSGDAAASGTQDASVDNQWEKLLDLTIPLQERISSAVDMIASGLDVPEGIIDTITEQSEQEAETTTPVVTTELSNGQEVVEDNILTVRADYKDKLTTDRMKTTQGRYVFEKKGSAFGCISDMYFFWSDGSEMTVPYEAITSMHIFNAKDGRKYQSGEWSAAPDIESMEVYSAKLTYPKYVIMTCEI